MSEDKIIKIALLYFQVVGFIAFTWAGVSSFGQPQYMIFWVLWILLAPLQVLFIYMNGKDFWREQNG